jgi:hypothetical protein
MRPLLRRLGGGGVLTMIRNAKSARNSGQSATKGSRAFDSGI